MTSGTKALASELKVRKNRHTADVIRTKRLEPNEERYSDVLPEQQSSFPLTTPFTTPNCRVVGDEPWRSF